MLESGGRCEISSSNSGRIEINSDARIELNSSNSSRIEINSAARIELNAANGNIELNSSNASVFASTTSFYVTNGSYTRFKHNSDGITSLTRGSNDVEGSPNTALHVKDIPYNISETTSQGSTWGTAVKGSTMSGLTLASNANGDESIGVWFGTNNSHWSGISGRRDASASNWGTQLSFYTHDNATSSLTSTYERVRIHESGVMQCFWHPCFSAYSAQGWTNLNAGDKVNFNGMWWSGTRSGGYSTSNKRFTAPVSGVYSFTVAMYMSSDNRENICAIVPRVNGSQIHNGTDNVFFWSVDCVNDQQLDGNTISGTVLLYLSENDYIEVYRRNGQSGTHKYYGGHSHFCGHLIS